MVQMNDVLALLNRTFGLDLLEEWDSSISASMVLMIFFCFMVSWILSPRYGLLSTLIRRANQRRRFKDQVVLGHIYHHQGQGDESHELVADALHAHFKWSPRMMRRVLARLQAHRLITIQHNSITLTPRGEQTVQAFKHEALVIG